MITNKKSQTQKQTNTKTEIILWNKKTIPLNKNSNESEARANLRVIDYQKQIILPR